MSVFITNIGMANQNERFIPAIIHITFSNGEKVVYEQRGDEITSISQLAQFTPPKYDFSEDEKTDQKTFDALHAKLSAQLRSLDKQYKSAVDEADRLFVLEKWNLDALFERRRSMNEQLHSTLSQVMLRSYKSVKKEMDQKLKNLEDPSKRIEIMARWLRETGCEELRMTALMLERDSEYIVGKFCSQENRWACFLSHVQAHSMDLCRLAKENLEKKGISAWLDKSADRVDVHGMVDGIVDSACFVILLTKDYFKRRYCALEYCIATMADKPVITVLETDTRLGGGLIDSFEFVGLFAHVKDHEIIEVSRKHWDSFLGNLQRRIRRTMEPRSYEGLRRKILIPLKPLNLFWNSKKMHPAWKLNRDMVKITCRHKVNSWSSFVGLPELRAGHRKFSVEVIKISRMNIGVVNQGYVANSRLGPSSWGYLSNGQKYNAGIAQAYGDRYSDGDVITIELEFGSKQITFYKNGKSQGVAFQNLSGPVFPAVSSHAEVGNSFRLKSSLEA